MHCPRCGGGVRSADVARRRCPKCESKIYWVDRWRWLRGISCGLVSLTVLAVLYRLYPFDHTLVWVFAYCAVWLAVSFALLVASLFLLPPAIDLVPPHGP